MVTLQIRNLGPVKEAHLTLNKINVFMGPRSSGKSTIAKVINYCTFIEKDVATTQLVNERKDRTYFREKLESYHNMQGYFQPDTYIAYQSDIIELEYKPEHFFIRWKDRYAYKKSKISYIPSERNMIILPEIQKALFPNSSIRSFLFDWFTARRNFLTNQRLPILNSGVYYYYSEGSDQDHITKYENGASYDILLSNASSGLQSTTSLVCMIDYLTDWIYRQDEVMSYEQEEARKKVDAELRTNKNLHVLLNSIFTTQNSQIIIEEPEQNLFPEIQRNLIYFLLEKCLVATRDHRLTITTHSPYILYALNNCMLGGLVGDKISEADKEKLQCKASLVDPALVSVYEIHDGVLQLIQQADGLISANYFDEKMKELMDDFYIMLNYYGV